MLHIKPFKQSWGLCGPASLKMVLDFYDVIKTEKELAELTHCTSDTGTTSEMLVEAAKSLGLSAVQKDSTELEELRSLVVDQETPVIVAWFSVDDGHYSVVVDMDNENIYLQDPSLGSLRSMRLDTFKRLWFDFPNDFIQTNDELIIRRMIVIKPQS